MSFASSSSAVMSSSAAESQDAAGAVTGAQASGTRSRRCISARLSGDVAHLSGNASADSRGPHRRLGRTPSSPSVLLYKVKERIREKVSRACDCTAVYIG